MLTISRFPWILTSLLVGLVMSGCPSGGTGDSGGSNDGGVPPGGEPDLSMMMMMPGPDLAARSVALSSAMPVRGPSAGGITVTLSGQLFQPGATVTIDGVAATSVNVLSAEMLTVMLPARLGVQGPVAVTVTNPDSSKVTRSDIFSYYSSQSTAWNKSFVFTGLGPDYAIDMDVNNKIDLVAVNGAAILTYFGNGDGTFQSAKSGPLQRPSGPAFSAALVANITGDRKPDAVDFSNDGYVEVFPGNGDGTFSAPLRSPSGAILPARTPLVGDINGDGNADIVATVDVDNYVVLLGTGTGAFQAPKAARFIQTLSSYCPPLLADVNNDNKQDLIYFGNNYYVYIHLSKGDGTFGVGNGYSMGGLGAQIVPGDQNLDGKLDFTFFSNPSGYSTSTVWTGGNDGTFQVAKVTNFPITYSILRYVGGFDFDADGIPDPVGYSNYSGIAIWMGNINTAFNVKTISGPDMKYLVVGDFDGNKKQDIAVQDLAATGVAIYLNVSQ